MYAQSHNDDAGEDSPAPQNRQVKIHHECPAGGALYGANTVAICYEWSEAIRPATDFEVPMITASMQQWFVFGASKEWLPVPGGRSQLERSILKPL